MPKSLSIDSISSRASAISSASTSSTPRPCRRSNKSRKVVIRQRALLEMDLFELGCDDLGRALNARRLPLSPLPSRKAASARTYPFAQFRLDAAGADEGVGRNRQALRRAAGSRARFSTGVLRFSDQTIEGPLGLGQRPARRDKLTSGSATRLPSARCRRITKSVRSPSPSPISTKLNLFNNRASFAVLVWSGTKTGRPNIVDRPVFSVLCKVQRLTNSRSPRRSSCIYSKRRCGS